MKQPSVETKIEEIVRMAMKDDNRSSAYMEFNVVRPIDALFSTQQAQMRDKIKRLETFDKEYPQSLCTYKAVKLADVLDIIEGEK